MVGFRDVVRAMEVIAPPRYAGSWDNVGVLIDRLQPTLPSPARLFLTLDLTEKVVREAERSGAHVIITYHPTPFRGLKKIHGSDPAGQIVLRCASQGIGVYSPHSALDVAPGGITDWLISPFSTAARPVTCFTGEETAGEGRMAELTTSLTLAECVQRVKDHLQLQTVRVAAAPHDSIAEVQMTADRMREHAKQVQMTADRMREHAKQVQ
eukprot:Hpha_TRINITY_DN7777_c0_g1::TRINITY_DN7777_c0_g1_i2::g.85468::m.85468